MRSKQIVSLILSVFLIVLATGCSKQDFAEVTLEPCVLELGEHRELAPFADSVGEGDDKAPVTITMNENTVTGLSATYADGKLSLVGEAPGQYNLAFTQSAKGYNDGPITMAVTVKDPPPPPIEAAVYSEHLGINDSLPPKRETPVVLDEGLLASVEIMSRVGDVTLTAQSSDPCLAVTIAGNSLTLDPVSAGIATLTVTATHPDYSDAVGTFEVEVRPPHVSLAFAGGVTPSFNVSVGQSTSIPLEYDGTLSLSLSTDNITAAIEGNGISITGVAEGDCEITITAFKDRHLDSTLTANVAVTSAPAPAKDTPQYPANKFPELEAEILEYINIERANIDAAPLTMDTTLSNAARLRAQETAVEQSHTRPDGRRGLTVIADFGIYKDAYSSVGENLAGADFAETAAEVVARWMDSPSHKSALLDDRFTATGVGVYYDGDMYRYCQLFGGAG